MIQAKSPFAQAIFWFEIFRRIPSADEKIDQSHRHRRPFVRNQIAYLDRDAVSISYIDNDVTKVMAICFPSKEVANILQSDNSRNIVAKSAVIQLRKGKSASLLRCRD